jgi:hypothetical protein
VPVAASGDSSRKRRVLVEQQLDALARQQLAAVVVAFQVLGAAAGAGERHLLVELGELREHAGPVLLEGVR